VRDSPHQKAIKMQIACATGVSEIFANSEVADITIK